MSRDGLAGVAGHDRACAGTGVLDLKSACDPPPRASNANGGPEAAAISLFHYQYRFPFRQSVLSARRGIDRFVGAADHRLCDRDQGPDRMSELTHTREITLRNRVLNAMALAVVTTAASASLYFADLWVLAAGVAALGIAFIAIVLRVKVVTTQAPEVIKARQELERQRQAEAVAREDALFGTVYSIGGLIVWIVTFIGCWIYCIANYGFLLGVGLGWLPAAIVASVAAILWPLMALAAMVAAFLMLRAT